MILPIQIQHLIEKYKSQYNIVGKDEEILKKIIPNLEDEDILRLYDELCYEEINHLGNKNSRPNFEKYREDLLDYLDDSIIKSEIIKREQKQSLKLDLSQRNYTYISEFTTTLDKNTDKKKIIKSFYRKINQLESERNLLDVKNSLYNIDLCIHIYKCILHITEKMDIDLILYRNFKPKKKYILQNYFDFKKFKKKKISSKQLEEHLKQIRLNYILEQINKLQQLRKELKLLEER